MKIETTAKSEKQKNLKTDSAPYDLNQRKESVWRPSSRIIPTTAKIVVRKLKRRLGQSKRHLSKGMKVERTRLEKELQVFGSHREGS